MFRTLFCGAVLAAVALPAQADQTVTPTETVIRLKVPSAPAPEPALRYLLLPELKELQPGNPIPNYLKCLMDQDSSNKAMPSHAALRLADRAARMDKPDWQILLKLKTDGIGLLIPDIQKTRQLAAGLAGRFREEVAQRRFDDAFVTAKTLFALSRHTGEHPTLIGSLVGIAIAFVAIGPLEEMLEQPGGPNLYWALTNLPRPFISLEKGTEGERLLFVSEFHDLDDEHPMTAEQIQKLLVHVEKVRGFDDRKRDKRTVRTILNERLKDPEAVPAACRRLVAAGFPEERIRRFPPDQVLLLDERRLYEVHRDDVMKLMALPAWQGEALYKQLKPVNEPAVFDLFIPAMFRVRRAQARLEQRMALLRHVEALRLYAAAHDGKLPSKLSEVVVPLLDDPFTGEPFRYRLDGATAHLRGSPPPGEEKNPAYNVHYEITIQK